MTFLTLKGYRWPHLKAMYTISKYKLNVGANKNVYLRFMNE